MKHYAFEPVSTTIQFLPVDFLKYNEQLSTIETRKELKEFIDEHTLNVIEGDLFVLFFVYKYQRKYFDFSVLQLGALNRIFTGTFRHRACGYTGHNSSGLYIGENAFGLTQDWKLLAWEHIEAAINSEFRKRFDLETFKSFYISEWEIFEEFFKNHRTPADFYIQFICNPGLLLL